MLSTLVFLHGCLVSLTETNQSSKKVVDSYLTKAFQRHGPIDEDTKKEEAKPMREVRVLNGDLPAFDSVSRSLKKKKQFEA